MELSGAYLIEPHIFKDERGFFLRCIMKKLSNTTVLMMFLFKTIFLIQKGVVRGLHFQTDPRNTAKLLRCVQGEIYDVIVDLRKSSPTFGKWEAVALSDKNMNILYIPKGFAHGFAF